MKVTAIRAHALDIAFNTTFSHASASREATQSLWVEARDEDGRTGYGEGCPREYVTGEDLAGALAFVDEHAAQCRRDVMDLASLTAGVDAWQTTIDRHPAAWTGIELALLDLFAKGAGQSVEGLLGLEELDGCFRYTAVLGDAEPGSFEAQLMRYLQAGFRDFKIKLSGDLPRDRVKVDALVQAGIPGGAVRADANNLWDDACPAIVYLNSLDYPFGAIEEPLAPGDYAGMSRIASSGSWGIILDESLLRLGQVALLPADTPWFVNVRVSKMGGLLRSLRLVDALRQAGHGLIVGAHVGETSLLTRAALTVAHASRDILIAQEGAFGTHLLERDVVERPIMFGAGGVLDGGSLALARNAGFGLQGLRTPGLMAG